MKFIQDKNTLKGTRTKQNLAWKSKLYNDKSRYKTKVHTWINMWIVKSPALSMVNLDPHPLPKSLLV